MDAGERSGWRTLEPPFLIARRARYLSQECYVGGGGGFARIGSAGSVMRSFPLMLGFFRLKLSYGRFDLVLPLELLVFCGVVGREVRNRDVHALQEFSRLGEEVSVHV